MLPTFLPLSFTPNSFASSSVALPQQLVLVLLDEVSVLP